MSNVNQLRISLEFNPESGLQPLGLTVPDQAVIQSAANAFGALSTAAGAGQDYTVPAIAQPLYDAVLLAVASAMSEGGLQFVNIHDAANNHIGQLKGQLESTVAKLQELQASFEQACQNAAQDGYARGIAAAEPAVQSAPANAVGGVTFSLDTAEIAKQIAAHLAAGQGNAVVTNTVTAAATAVQTTAPTGGLQLGGGLNLGKSKAAQGATAQPVTASGANDAASAYSLDPATIGGGLGSGGGTVNTSAAADGKTVKAIRGDSSLEKIGLPTAKKKFAGGAIVYILPSSENAQWDDKAPVVADPKEGGNLEEIAEGAKTSLMKSLHYYAEV